MKSDLLKAYCRLYDSSSKLSTSPSLCGRDASDFWFKRGLPVAFVEVKKSLEVIPYDVSCIPFFQRNEVFWLIPIDGCNSEVVGFVLKAVDKKDYRVVRAVGTPQVMYGYHNFSVYKGEPVIVTEGVRDAFYIDRFYSYVFAVLSSGLSDFNIRFLSKLTSVVLLGFDNDDAGEKASYDFSKKFSNHNVRTVRFRPVLKDWGKYFESAVWESVFVKQLNEIVGGRV